MKYLKTFLLLMFVLGTFWLAIHLRNNHERQLAIDNHSEISKETLER